MFFCIFVNCINDKKKYVQRPINLQPFPVVARGIPDLSQRLSVVIETLMRKANCLIEYTLPIR